MNPMHPQKHEAAEVMPILLLFHISIALADDKAQHVVQEKHMQDLSVKGLKMFVTGS